MKSSDPITNLISAFSRLPGIGERTASRLAFFVLNQPADLATELAEALVDVKDRVGLCERCCNLTESTYCSICRAPKRDRNTICVVESAPDLRAVENTGDFRGTYHVLHGLISPLEGIGPDDIHVAELLSRLGTGSKRTSRATSHGSADSFEARSSAERHDSSSALGGAEAGSNFDSEADVGAATSDDSNSGDAKPDGSPESIPDEAIEEIIIATSPSVDGEATALYLARLIKPLEIKVSRIASGVPMGTELEYADRVTLSRAMSQRHEL